MVSSEDSAWDVPPSIFGTRAGGPTVQRLVLGGQLHKLRESRGITAEQAAEAIRGSHSKISRMEHGRVGFKERDVGSHPATASAGRRKYRHERRPAVIAPLDGPAPS